jgi:hypothetical protein
VASQTANRIWTIRMVVIAKCVGHSIPHRVDVISNGLIVTEPECHVNRDYDDPQKADLGSVDVPGGCTV